MTSASKLGLFVYMVKNKMQPCYFQKRKRHYLINADFTFYSELTFNGTKNRNDLHTANVCIKKEPHVWLGVKVAVLCTERCLSATALNSKHL